MHSFLILSSLSTHPMQHPHLHYIKVYSLVGFLSTNIQFHDTLQSRIVIKTRNRTLEPKLEWQHLEIEQPKLLRNSNGLNFSLGGPIQAHNILRRSKLNNRSSREIQMVITNFIHQFFFTFLPMREKK